MCSLKSYLFIVLSSCFFLSCNTLANPVFKAEPIKLNTKIQYTDKLCQLSTNTLSYYQHHASEDSYAIHPVHLGHSVISKQAIVDTLNYICFIKHQDRQTGKNRLADPQFISKHFNFIRWYPDKQKANHIAKKSKNQRKQALLFGIPETKIFLTKYYTKLLNGSSKPTAKYNQALYALPFDEQGLSKNQALLQKHNLTRFKYTRQQVMKGVLTDNRLAQPLIWLTAEALHDVLLQGTGVVKVGDKLRYFNVHRNNGIAYDYHKGKQQQARYWYFAEVKGILGYGKTLASKIEVIPQITVAGNLRQFALGQLLLLQYQQQGTTVNRMAILADEGGAFTDNSFQLDLLTNSYHGWNDYYQENRTIPDYVNAWIMLKK